jgi:hypothetical protein
MLTGQAVSSRKPQSLPVYTILLRRFKMSKLEWDKIGERIYETGVKHGVLYNQVAGAYPKGVAWNGFTAFTESPSGAEPNNVYADDRKYLILMSIEELGGTLEALSYPPEFNECDGVREPIPGMYVGQQTRKPFGLSYTTTVGNDTEFNDYGYKIHVIYGAMASPSEKNYSTINDSPEAAPFSWDLTTTPVDVTKMPDVKSTASLVFDSTVLTKAQMTAIEEVLFGSEDDEARLPLPDELYTIIQTAAA